MATPTRTINPLHFEDLDARRFEDLALALVYRQRPWEDIHHDGRLGGDAGVDIRAVEKLVDASLRHWAVQCKRYRSFAAAEAKAAVAEVVNHAATPPDVLLLVVGCDVSHTTRTAFEVEAAAAGVGTPMLWTASKLEAMLYADHPDLLFGYFGVSLARRERSREGDIKRGLALKRKLVKVFPPRCGHPDIIIHSIDDEFYPEVDAEPEGRISGWFKTEFGGHYHNGVELLLRVEDIIVDRNDGRWAFIDHRDPAFDPARYALVKVFTVARIPFRNIVEVDEDGDEYYRNVHLYCRFAEAARPTRSFCSESWTAMLSSEPRRSSPSQIGRWQLVEQSGQSMWRGGWRSNVDGASAVKPSGGSQVGYLQVPRALRHPA